MAARTPTQTQVGVTAQLLGAYISISHSQHALLTQASCSPYLRPPFAPAPYCLWDRFIQPTLVLS